MVQTEAHKQHSVIANLGRMFLVINDSDITVFTVTTLTLINERSHFCTLTTSAVGPVSQTLKADLIRLILMIESHRNQT